MFFLLKTDFFQPFSAGGKAMKKVMMVLIVVGSLISIPVSAFAESDSRVVMDCHSESLIVLDRYYVVFRSPLEKAFAGEEFESVFRFNFIPKINKTNITHPWILLKEQSVLICYVPSHYLDHPRQFYLVGGILGYVRYDEASKIIQIAAEKFADSIGELYELMQKVRGNIKIDREKKGYKEINPKVDYVFTYSGWPYMFPGMVEETSIKISDFKPIRIAFKLHTRSDQQNGTIAPVEYTGCTIFIHVDLYQPCDGRSYSERISLLDLNLAIGSLKKWNLVPLSELELL
jgi:hypothetical protein